MEISTELERELFLAGYYKAFGMGDGPCFRCGQDESSCALGDGCRFPELMRPSMEACGIDVYKTVRDNGWQIEVVQTRSDQTTDIGLALIE
jgi:predicted metal-binding protein